MTRLHSVFLVLLVGATGGCTGLLVTQGADGGSGTPGEPGRDAGPMIDLLPGTDGGTRPPGVPPGVDAGTRPPDIVPEGGRRPNVPVDGARPVEIMPVDRLRDVASRMPQVADPELLAILESADTMWYSKQSIIPGYQDSAGGGEFPIGMRPNTIDPGLIAVPGGHGWVFRNVGEFHFPFDRPAGSSPDDLQAVDFFRLPRDESGAIRPVIYWLREPNSSTHRVEWLFPAGTVFGEILFIHDGGELWPFEIRTRTRNIDSWTSNVFRPFPTAADLAAALERVRATRAEWASSPEITSLIEHARDPSTLRSATLSERNFPGTFETITGAEDELPALSDDSILRELLMSTPFRSARGAVWKESGDLRAYAPTTSAGFQIVPRGYTGGFLSVDDETCQRCHRDAARPFRDWYPDIILYGELWGGDDTFTWHPFVTERFVDVRSGRVVDFNGDNREIRPDWLAAGIIERRSASHSESIYRAVPAEWKDYRYF